MQSTASPTLIQSGREHTKQQTVTCHLSPEAKLSAISGLQSVQERVFKLPPGDPEQRQNARWWTTARNGAGEVREFVKAESSSATRNAA